MMNSRAYCKTRHDGRMWNFNQEMTRSAGLPKMCPGFPKLCPVFQNWVPVFLISGHFWIEIPHSFNMASPTISSTLLSEKGIDK